MCDCEAIVWEDLDNLLKKNVDRLVCFIRESACAETKTVHFLKLWLGMEYHYIHDIYSQYNFPVYLRYRGRVWDPDLFCLLSHSFALDYAQIGSKNIFCCNYILTSKLGSLLVGSLQQCQYIFVSLVCQLLSVFSELELLWTHHALNICFCFLGLCWK